MSDLLPCPFCGSDVGITHIYDGEEVISCYGCGMGMRDDTPKLLANKWNTRADHIPDTSKMMWISVDDRLPDNLDAVLLCVEGMEWPVVGIYDAVKENFYNAAYFEDEYIATHWMKLPQPPV